MVDPGSQKEFAATVSEQSPVSEPITVPVSGQGVAAATPAAVASVEADGTDPAAADTQSSQAPALIVDPIPQTPVPDPAPVGAVHGVLTAAEDTRPNPLAALGDLLPTDSPLAWTMLAAARRDSLGISITNPPARRATPST
jgi:hypothetical protein